MMERPARLLSRPVARLIGLLLLMLLALMVNLSSLYSTAEIP